MCWYPQFAWPPPVKGDDLRPGADRYEDDEDRRSHMTPARRRELELAEQEEERG
jgi:hypothetical protein